MKVSVFRNIALIMGLSIVAIAHADDRLSINGFGYQDYRVASGNVSHSGADQRGTWDNNFFAIVSSYRISDRDVVWAQLQTNSTEQTRFTWVFLNHRFSNNLSIHIGRVKFPYGLYNEYVDNKALQLSAVEPIAYSGAADMVYDAYSGVGVDWTAGSMFTQVYFGDIYDTPPAIVSVPYPVPDDNMADRRLLGLRLTWNTPYEGLRLMLSANGTQVQDSVAGSSNQLATEARMMGSVDYVSDRFDIKAEYNYHKVPTLQNTTGVTSNAWYVQGGYKTGKWTPYVRYESYQRNKYKASDPSYYQKEFVFGVNYKISDNINARVEDHIIHGYALPLAAGEMDPTVPHKTNWNMAAAEVNFLF